MGHRQKFFLGERLEFIDIEKFIKEYKGSEWVNAVNTAGETPLHIAARYNNPEQFKLMLPYFTNIEATSRNGNTVLHVLADHNVDFQGYTKQCIAVLRTLIAKDANLNRRNKNGWTVVHYAAIHCNIEMLKFLKKSGASFDFRSIEDETPLILACKYMSDRKHNLVEAKTIDFLMNTDSDINFTSVKGYSALHYAVKKCSKKTVMMLLKRGANPNIRTRDRGLTPLHFAVRRSSNLSVVESLIKAGASLKPSETEELTPLHISLLEGSTEVVEYLIEKGADVNCPDKILQLTPLHLAIYQQRYDLFQLLIAAGADVHNCSKDNLTPLHLSSILGCSQFTQILMYLGANVDCLYDNDLTPLHLVSLATNTLEKDMLTKTDAIINTKKRSFIAKMLTRPPDKITKEKNKLPKEYEIVIQLLLRKGADVNALTTRGWSPLHFAAKSGRHTAHFLKILLEYGADVDLREPSSGFTALHFASTNNFDTAVQVLINAGADVNATTLDGRKPIHLALEKKLKDVVRVLIEGGADVNALTVDGKNPLHLALESNFYEALKLLTEAGAEVNALTEDGKNPLHLALESNSYEALKLLIVHGAKFNCKGNRCLYTLLYISARNNDDNLIDQLQNYKKTRLLEAIDSLKDKDMKKELMCLCAIVNSRNRKGCMAPNFEINNDYIDICKSLHINRVNDQHSEVYCQLMCDRILSGALQETNFTQGKIRKPQYVNAYLSMMNAVKLPRSGSRTTYSRKQSVAVYLNNRAVPYYNRCLDEVDKLKGYFIDDRITLYQVLRMKPMKRRIYTKKFNLEEIESEFQIYYKLALARYREDVIRNTLVDAVHLALYQFARIELPIVCIEKIFDDLSAMDMIAMIEAADIINGN